MNSCDLVASITAIACQISQGKSTDEIEFLAAILSQLGDTLVTIAINNSIIQSKEDE